MSCADYYYGGSVEGRVADVHEEIKKLSEDEKNDNTLYKSITTDTSLSSTLRSLGIHPTKDGGVPWIELLLECGVNTLDTSCAVERETLKSNMRRIIGDDVVLKIKEGDQSTPRHNLENLQKIDLLLAYIRGMKYQFLRFSKQRIQPGVVYPFDKNDITPFIQDLIGKIPNGDYKFPNRIELWTRSLCALFSRVCDSIEGSDTFRPLFDKGYRAVVHVIHDLDSYYFYCQHSLYGGRKHVLVCEFLINSEKHELFLSKLWWPTEPRFLTDQQTLTASTATSETTDERVGLRA